MFTINGNLWNVKNESECFSVCTGAYAHFPAEDSGKIQRIRVACGVRDDAHGQVGIFQKNTCLAEPMNAAGISVAMGNACTELRDMADFVCESVQEDGIYYAFRRMGIC